MKKAIGNSLKIGLPLGLGIFLVYWMFRDISEQDKKELLISFETADYFWIVLSIFAGLLSHLSRAYRWMFTLKPLGYEPRLINTFLTVMIGYLVNLLIPRMGEVSRCAYLAKHENMEFNKVFGTVIAERVVDFFALILFILIVFYIQFDILGKYLMETPLFQKLTNPTSLIIIVIIGAVFAFIGYRFLNISTNSFIVKVKLFIVGIFDGVKAIAQMENKWAFLFHTFFIWGMYVFMFYITFFSMEGVKEAPLGAVISSFVAGGIAVAATNGGLGAYPLAIMGILSLYGIDENTGKAFGWIIWTAQTIMVIAIGLLSILIIPFINKNYKRVKS